MRIPKLALCAAAIGAASVVCSPSIASAEIRVAKSVPPKEAERLQLTIDALTKDRPAQKYKAAQEKLEKAISKCVADPECDAESKSSLETYLGVVLADSDQESKAVEAFVRALTLDPTTTLGTGQLVNPKTQAAFAKAVAQRPTPPVSVEAKPADGGMNQPTGGVETKPLSEIAGAKWQPGVGFVEGADTAEPAVAAEGTGNAIGVPGFDQSTWFDHLMDGAFPRFAFAIPFNHYDFSWATRRRETLDGVGLDMRLGLGWVLAEVLVPHLEVGFAFGKAGDSPNVLLFSGGNYEVWNVNTDIRAGIDFDVRWFSIGGFGGGWLAYYAPSIENLPGEPDDDGTDLGPYFGARASLLSFPYMGVEYAWRLGDQHLARYRRLELGYRKEELDDDSISWAFYWEERESPGFAPGTASQDTRVIHGFPIERTFGFVFRTY